MSKNLKVLGIGVLLISLVGIGSGLLVFQKTSNQGMENKQQKQNIEVVKNGNSQSQKQEIKNKNNKIKKDKEISEGVYNGWNEYYNTEYNFIINYPNSMNKDDNYEDSIADNIVSIVSFDNFSKNRVGYMQDGDLMVSIKLYCVNDHIDFKSCYKNKIKYTKEKRQKEIDFMKARSNIKLSEKDIIYKESEVSIHGQLFKVQYRKYSKPNYIEGGPIVIKEYASINRDRIYNIVCITPNTKNADHMINLADKIVGSLRFDDLKSL
jgi:hypothetical protein